MQRVTILPESDTIGTRTYYSKKALFSRDLQRHTDWIFLEAEDFDARYTCVSDGSRIYYLDADLNQPADMPAFQGRGLMLADGPLLRGTINGHLTVADRAGNILMKDQDLSLLEGGVKSRTVTWYPHEHSFITYPVLEGMSDTGLQDELNRVIEEKAKGFWRFRPDPEDPYFFPIVEVYSTVQIKKDLMHIDLLEYEYWFGAHGGHTWDNVYVNIRNGKVYTLDDLFKSPAEARKRLSGKVSEAMAEERGKYFEDEVQPEQLQRFHLEDEGLLIYFDEYEIAPYAAGMPEFYIPYSEIMDLIDTEGDFWRAFN